MTALDLLSISIAILFPVIALYFLKTKDRSKAVDDSWEKNR